jgi:hypothetical protein
MTRAGAVVLLASTVTLGSCTSLEPGRADVRTVTDAQDLAGCTKVGLLPYDDFGREDPATREKLRQQVTNLGGNAIQFGDIGGIRRYIEVWSCPVERSAGNP